MILLIDVCRNGRRTHFARLESVTFAEFRDAMSRIGRLCINEGTDTAGVTSVLVY